MTSACAMLTERLLLLPLHWRLLLVPIQLNSDTYLYVVFAYIHFWWILTHPLAKRRFSIYRRSASAVTPSKRVQLTLIGNPLRAFPCTSVRRLAVTKRPCDWFYLIFARSASAVTASEKSSINTTMKSTTRFPISLRWIVYVDPKPQRGL